MTSDRTCLGGSKGVGDVACKRCRFPKVTSQGSGQMVSVGQGAGMAGEGQARDL
jgi:hypothetical protein